MKTEALLIEIAPLLQDLEDDPAYHYVFGTACGPQTEGQRWVGLEWMDQAFERGLVLPIFNVGTQVWFAEEKRPFTVRAADQRFAVCTKPFNVRNTVLYTVIDLQRDIRGTENLVFGMGAETDKQCAEMLERLATGDTEVSHRNNVPLRIVRTEVRP